MEMSKLNLWVKIFFSLAIVCLALAITYFSYALITVNKQIPDVLQQINESSQKVSDVVGVVDTITTQIPEILAEVQQLRQQIPSILNEVAAVRKQVPLMLQEAEAVRQQIPEILKELAVLRQQIPPILDEMAAYRAVIPKVLTEVATVRETIPPTLDRLDLLVVEAEKMTKNLGQNAVQNVFTGIIKAPFKLVQGLGEGLFPEEDLSAADEQLIADKALELLNNGEINQTIPIKSTTSTLTGEVTLVAEKTIDEQSCRVLKLTLKKVGEQVGTLCRDQKGEWKVQKPDN